MIETKKLNDATLRRITRSDNTTEDVHLTDVPNNVIESGTQITDTVLANINYKDDKTIEFSITNDDVLPSAGKAIFYVKGGKLYCAIDGYEPLEITSLSASNLIPKKGTTYVSNGALEYFNLGSSLKLFSTRTRIGTIPPRQEETSNINDATYIDFSTENILGKVNNIEKFKLGDKVEIKNSGSSINIDSDGDINLIHDSNSKIELTEERFSIKGKSTDIGIDSNKTKFNCHTSLTKASYGNSKYRLQFEDTTKLKNMDNNTNLVSISSNGVVTYNSMDLKDGYSEIKTENSAFKIRTSKEGLYILNPTFNLEMTGSTVRIKNQSDTLFEVRNNGNVYIGNKTIDELIQGKIDEYDSRILLSNQVDTRLSLTLDDSNYKYTVHFSDTANTNVIMSITFDGNNVGSIGRFYRKETTSYYQLNQHYAIDDSDYDYVEIIKVTSNGSYISNAYFRGIYYIYK